MACDDRITLLTLDAQKRVFRLAERNHGLRLKTISLDSGIPYNTIRSYSHDTIMPLPAFLKLVDIIPDELLSQLLDPVKRCLAPTTDDGDPDLDALGQESLDLGATIAQSRSPNSPGGTNIVPIERAQILMKVARVAKKAGRAA
jgi:hypothetical protein